MKVSCDLMLYWNEKQSQVYKIGNHARCDLMLYWNEKQSSPRIGRERRVVIWCSIEMRNSALWPSTRPIQVWFDALLKWETGAKSSGEWGWSLWFDALLKWETVSWTDIGSESGCDLMLYWNEKQLNMNVRAEGTVVIWCSIEMRNSRQIGACPEPAVVIWCSIEMRNSMSTQKRVTQ